MRDGRNAQEELIQHLEKVDSPLVCAKVIHQYDDEVSKEFILKAGHNQSELQAFLNSLDFQYDNGFGGQELFGLLLFEDSYSERGEYDGAEWWENKRKPSIDEVMSYSPEEI